MYFVMMDTDHGCYVSASETANGALQLLLNKRNVIQKRNKQKELTMEELFEMYEVKVTKIELNHCEIIL